MGEQEEERTEAVYLRIYNGPHINYEILLREIEIWLITRFGRDPEIWSRVQANNDWMIFKFKDIETALFFKIGFECAGVHAKAIFGPTWIPRMELVKVSLREPLGYIFV